MLGTILERSYCFAHFFSLWTPSVFALDWEWLGLVFSLRLLAGLGVVEFGFLPASSRWIGSGWVGFSPSVFALDREWLSLVFSLRLLAGLGRICDFRERQFSSKLF